MMATDPSTNPLAWAKWAMQQDAGTYDQGRASFSADPYQVKANRGMLERAGLWNPEWESWFQDQEGAVAQPDFSGLDGYSAQVYRGPENSRFAELLDPSGNAVGQDQWEHSGSMKGSDWMQAAMTVGGPMFAAAGGAGALGNSLFGMQGAAGAAAGGAVAGGATGGLNAAANGGNILTGALKGGLLGGAGGYLGSVASEYLGGGFQPVPETGLSPMDFNPSDYYSGALDPTNALRSLPDVGQVPGMMPNMPPADFAGPSVNVNSGNPLDPMPQFNAPPGAPGQYELTNPVGGFPGTDGGGFDPSMTRFMPPSLPSLPQTQTQAPAQQPPAQQPAPETPPADPSFRPSQNYGDGLTGNQTGAYDAVIGATGSAGLANAAAGATGAAGTIGGLVNAVGGLGTILPVLGAVAGSQPSGGGTTTRDSRTDPRFDPYLYGDGGFLPSAKAWFDQNKSGANDTMRAGWNQQLGLLNDPQISQQLAGMRNQGLLASQGSIAGNPFTRGQAPSQGLLADFSSLPSAPQQSNPIQPGQQQASRPPAVGLNGGQAELGGGNFASLNPHGAAPMWDLQGNLISGGTMQYPRPSDRRTTG